MVTVKAVQPFGSTNSQDPASVFFNTISPRPEAGTGAHADGGAEHVITVQCQALACGATLQVGQRRAIGLQEPDRWWW